MTEGYPLLISGPHSRIMPSLLLQCIFPLNYFSIFIDSICPPSSSLLMVLKTEEAYLPLGIPSTEFPWSLSAQRLLNKSTPINQSLTRARAPSSGQTQNLLGRLWEQRVFEKEEMEGSWEYGGTSAGPRAPYLCTATPAVRGPRARTHSGRRRWGPCSCGYRTCGAC